MALHDVLHDREPQTRARPQPSARINAIETLKHTSEMLSGNSWAIVGNGNEHATFRALDLHFYN